MAEPMSQQQFSSNGVQVATVSTDLDLGLLDHLLGALESALVVAGATRVWIDPDLPALTLMAEFRDGDTDDSDASRSPE